MLLNQRSSLGGCELFQLGAVVGDDELDEEQERLGLLVVFILEHTGCILHIALLWIENNGKLI